MASTDVPGPRPVHVHIGASKTGTSALQRGIFDSSESLADQGVGLPLRGRDPHVRRLLTPLGWRPALGFVDAPDAERVRSLAARLRRTPGASLLLTCEDLCEADPARIALIRDTLDAADLEPRIVLTVRSLASVVPSEWQQLIKRRLDLSYPDFLRCLRDREGVWADQFWQRQDVIATCQRWADVVGEQQIDVVVTPSRAADPGGLFRLFGEVVGFDPARMTWSDRDINASWGYVEAEIYRRVNAALGTRLQRHQRGYLTAVRRPMVKGVLPRRASERIPFPPEHLPWLADVARSHVAWLRERCIRVHGDLDGLVPGPDSGSPLPEVDEADIADGAVAALANMAVFHHRRAAADRSRGPDQPRS